MKSTYGRYYKNISQHLIRTCIFRPFIWGDRVGRINPPVFTLQLFFNGYAIEKYDTRNVYAYKLHMKKDGKSILLFKGDEFSTPGNWESTSDKVVQNLMGCLTTTSLDLEKLTEQVQFNYCEKYAESLMCEVNGRFGEE